MNIVAINGARNFPFLITFVGFFTTLFGSTIIARALAIEPNHDKPCVVGDAWAEECMSCICLEGRIATCKPSFCATRLRRELDDCKEGEITQIDCNTCQCKNNARVCTKKDCSKGDQQGAGAHHNRKSKKKEKKAKRAKGKV